MEDSDDKAASGLVWGFELESIILEIIGDADEIPEDKLLNLLISRPELQTLLASSIEFIQKIPELDKKYASYINQNNGFKKRLTIKGELKILIDDITSGLYHKMYVGTYPPNFNQKDPHRKLERKVVQYENKPPCAFIKRLTDEYSMR